MFCGGSCAQEVQDPGQLILSLETDMAMPQQIDTILIQVSVRGDVRLEQDYSVGSSSDRDNRIPATLTLVAGENPSTPVTIRVSGSKQRAWRTFREVITTIPPNRRALLRMPIQWLCDETATVMSSEVAGVSKNLPASTCGEGNACRAGQCVPSRVESSTLPDYTAPEVFGDATGPGAGTCFDTVSCMIKGSVVVPDADCTVPKPEGDVNVALRVTNDGICDNTGTACFVPLNGNSSEGWSLTAAGDRIALPKAVCEKLQERRINAVYVSTECRTKTERYPPCGEWSSVPKRTPIAAQPGVDGEFPRPTLIAELPNENSAAPCCPLMSDAGKLYACVCASATNATLFEVDPSRRGAPRSVGTLNPPASRQNQSFFAATVYNQALYWSADREIQRTPLAGNNALADSFPVDGAVYETATLLADASGVYALASGVAGAEGSPVQLLKIDPMGNVQALDTRGNIPVYQFDQDDAAVYLASDLDAAAESGGLIQRTSRVVRIDKAVNTQSNVLPETTLMIEDPKQGGYTAVEVQGTRVFALFEAAPAEDGTIRVEVRSAEIAAAMSGSDEGNKLYTLSIDPKRTQIRLQGVSEGSVVLSRVEYEGSTVRGSSVLAVPPSGGPRIVADFPRDYPQPGLAEDADRVYWLNNSGRLYGLSRIALR